MTETTSFDRPSFVLHGTERAMKMILENLQKNDTREVTSAIFIQLLNAEASIPVQESTSDPTERPREKRRFNKIKNLLILMSNYGITAIKLETADDTQIFTISELQEDPALVAELLANYI